MLLGLEQGSGARMWPNGPGLGVAETPKDLSLRSLAAERHKCSRSGGLRAPKRLGLAGGSAEHAQQSRGQSCPKPGSCGQEGRSEPGQCEHTRGRPRGAQTSAGLLHVAERLAGDRSYGSGWEGQRTRAGPEPVTRGGQ